MKPLHHSTQQAIHRASLRMRMLQGASIAIIPISLFLITAGEDNPAWGPLWRLRPLIVVPIAGAMGGVLYYYLDHIRVLGGWKTVLATILSLIGYTIAIWLGSVLGLAGTYWD